MGSVQGTSGHGAAAHCEFVTSSCPAYCQLQSLSVCAQDAGEEEVFHSSVALSAVYLECLLYTLECSRANSDVNTENYQPLLYAVSEQFPISQLKILLVVH